MAGFVKDRVFWHMSADYFFLSLQEAQRDFFFSLNCENLVTLLDVKITKCKELLTLRLFQNELPRNFSIIV